MKGKVMQFKIGNINFEYSGEYNRKSTVENIAILKKTEVSHFFNPAFISLTVLESIT